MVNVKGKPNWAWGRGLWREMGQKMQQRWVWWLPLVIPALEEAEAGQPELHSETLR